jgi:hypothetical protein
MGYHKYLFKGSKIITNKKNKMYRSNNHKNSKQKILKMLKVHRILLYLTLSKEVTTYSSRENRCSGNLLVSEELHDYLRAERQYKIKYRSPHAIEGKLI